MSAYHDFIERLRACFFGLLPTYIGTAHSRAGTKVSQKADGTPVTNLDTYAAGAYQYVISGSFPGERTLGEEDGQTDEQIKAMVASGEPLWTIDGLDGTGHYRAKRHSYGAMISRRVENRIAFAAVMLPVDARLYGTGFIVCAEDGLGAREWCQEHRRYEQRLPLVPDGARLEVGLEGSSKRFFADERIVRLGRRETTRPSMSSSVAVASLVRGELGAIVTRGNKPWDNWPMIGLVHAAGGLVTDFGGNPIWLDNCGDIILAADSQSAGRCIELLAAP